MYTVLFAFTLLFLWAETALALFTPLPALPVKILMLGNLIAWGIVYLDPTAPQN